MREFEYLDYIDAIQNDKREEAKSHRLEQIKVMLFNNGIKYNKIKQKEVENGDKSY